MAGKVVNSSFVLLSKFGASRQERASKTATSHIRETLGNMLKEPTHIQAHLVFADTQSPNKKPKELEFLPTLGRHRKEKE
jgi:hypothetical protein